MNVQIEYLTSALALTRKTADKASQATLNKQLVVGGWEKETAKERDEVLYRIVKMLGSKEGDIVDSNHWTRSLTVGVISVAEMKNQALARFISEQ